MSLINNYLKKAALKQQRNETSADVPPFLLQEDGQTGEDRSLTLMIALLFVLLILLTGSGYLFFFRESREPSPFTEIKPPRAPASFDRPKPSRSIGQTGAGQEKEGTHEEKPVDRSAAPAPSPERVQPAVPRIYAVEGPVVEPAQETAGEKTGTEQPAATASAREDRAEGQKTQQPDAVAIQRTDTEKKPTEDAAQVKEWPLPLAAGEQGETGPAATGAQSVQVQAVSKRQLFRDARNEASYLYQIGLQAQKSGDLGRAERYYRLALRQKADHLDSLINLSAVYIREGRFDDARPLLDRILEIDADNAKALVNQGMIAMHIGKNTEAEKAFKKALEIDPTEETALVNLAYIAQQSGRIGAAEEYYQRLLKIAPKNREALLAYANLEENSGKYAVAIGLYSRCLEQLSMQQDQALYTRIRNRINLLRQYLIQQSYKKFYAEPQ